jgi:hypothetical protein
MTARIFSRPLSLSDPFPRPLSSGAFAETDATKAISLIYLEQIRESALSPDGLSVDNGKFDMILRRVVAHEIGHCPDSGGDTSDHGEGGLMDTFNLQAGGDDPTFGARTIKRMRDADSWKK